MKKLIYAATFTLMLASSIPAALATGIPGDSKSSHIVGSRAYPDYPTYKAIHDFDVHIEGEAISELSIKLPNVQARGVEVSYQSGDKIVATTSVKGSKATVVFSQPVPPGTVLTVSVQDVYGSISQADTYIYRVRAKKVGQNSESEVGTAYVRTIPRW